MVEQVLRQLPVGISDWNSIRAGNYFFIDKTRMLRNLLLGGMDKVFLARPSGMGRTTLLSMIEELFTHGDQNFVGTDIYGKWPENERYPVIRLDFSQIQGMYLQLKENRQILVQIRGYFRSKRPIWHRG